MSEAFYTSTLQKKRRRGQRLTPAQRIRAQAAFLSSYEQTANVLQAAERAEIDRTLVYYWLEHDEQFNFAYHIADEAANRHIEAEIRRRAIDGWDEPLISAGKRLGTVRKYSDTLLIFYAKRRMPEYRDKQPEFQINNHVNAQAVAEEYNEAVAKALEAYPEAQRAVAAALFAKGKQS